MKITLRELNVLFNTSFDLGNNILKFLQGVHEHPVCTIKNVSTMTLPCKQIFILDSILN